MQSRQLGAYVHIPFCIQRCSYCDFATYAKDQIAPNDNYVDTLVDEINKRQHLFQQRELRTIYFGGGTPSLLEASQIKRIIDSYKEVGFDFHKDIEITIEVNPATLNQAKCEQLKQAGVNRISIGCQSFDDKYLKICNREHNVADTFNTIEMAQTYFDNYSLDLLFSLPSQGIEQLKRDLAIITEISPPHVSAYCLTLPVSHPMNKGRCSEDEQVEMFDLIFKRLAETGLKRYEISNFAKPGFESRHNNLYWSDDNYWGVGLSAHSYRAEPDWGFRFWNASGYKAYMKEIQTLSPALPLKQAYSKEQLEGLKKHESLTDFCHTHLRLAEGLAETSLRQKFGNSCLELVRERITPLCQQELIFKSNDHWNLTDKGVLVSNQVFSHLLFSQSDIDKIEK